MKFKVFALIVVIGALAGRAWAEQPGVPNGEWSGDITSRCTVNDTDTDLVFRYPHIDVQCSSGRCFAQLSFEMYEKDTDEIVQISIPGLENFGNRLTIIGWGPIIGRNVENGNVQGLDSHEVQGLDSHEQEDAEAYLDGLTTVFLPNGDLSISIDHARLKCGGILLPKLP